MDHWWPQGQSEKKKGGGEGRRGGAGEAGKGLGSKDPSYTGQSAEFQISDDGKSGTQRARATELGSVKSLGSEAPS